MPQVQIDPATREVLAVGFFPTPPQGVAVVEIDQVEANKLVTLRGRKTLGVDGVVTAALDPAILAAETARAAEEAVLDAERTLIAGLRAKLDGGANLTQAELRDTLRFLLRRTT